MLKAERVILEDPEFENLRDTPSVVRDAVTNHPTDPRGFLRTMLETERSILEDPEFENLRDTPGVIRQAVVYWPTDPRGFLRKMLESAFTT
jgi:hypothetical protein